MTATANAHRVSGGADTVALDARLDAYKFNPAQPRDLQGRWVRLAGYWTPDVPWKGHPLGEQGTNPALTRKWTKDPYGHITVKVGDLLPGDVVDSSDVGRSLGEIYEDNWVHVDRVTDDRLYVSTLPQGPTSRGTSIPLDEPIEGDIDDAPLRDRFIFLMSDPVKDVEVPPPSMPVGAVPITGLPPDRTLAVAALLDRYEKLMPGSMRGLTGISATDSYPNSIDIEIEGETKSAIAQYDDQAMNITINGEYANEAKAWDRSWRYGRFVKCAKAKRADYSIAHELGHHVADNRMTPAQQIDFMRTIIPDEYADLVPQFEAGAQIPPDALANPEPWMVQQYGQLWQMWLLPAIAENSGYSAEGGYKEAMAEAFAAAVIGDPSKLGTKVRRWMKANPLP